MAVLAMFPLGAVLFPHMPLHLRVFEQRYLVMLGDLMRSNSAVFGVVLIERGGEVGGGEQRFDVGTTAQISELGAQEGVVGLVAHGGRRFEVLEWLPDEPHPRAEIRELPELRWDQSLETLRDEVEQLVRRTLALASEFSEDVWPADVELSEDPVAAAWQLAAITPLSTLDQLTLLRSASLPELLEGIRRLTQDAAVIYEMPWPKE